MCERESSICRCFWLSICDKKNMDKRQCQNNIHTILEQTSLKNSKDQFWYLEIQCFCFNILTLFLLKSPKKTPLKIFSLSFFLVNNTFILQYYFKKATEQHISNYSLVLIVVKITVSVFVSADFPSLQFRFKRCYTVVCWCGNINFRRDSCAV